MNLLHSNNKHDAYHILYPAKDLRYAFIFGCNMKKGKTQEKRARNQNEVLFTMI